MEQSAQYEYGSVGVWSGECGEWENGAMRSTRGSTAASQCCAELQQYSTQQQTAAQAELSNNLTHHLSSLPHSHSMPLCRLLSQCRVKQQRTVHL